jgi:hypothetical protein
VEEDPTFALSESDRQTLRHFLLRGATSRAATAGTTEPSFGQLYRCTLIVSQDQPSKSDRKAKVYELRLLPALSSVPRTAGRLILVARRWRRARTPHYVISMNPADLRRPRTKRSDGYLGKLRGDGNGAIFTLYDDKDARLRQELAAVVFGAGAGGGRWQSNRSRAVGSVTVARSERRKKSAHGVADARCDEKDGEKHGEEEDEESVRERRMDAAVWLPGCGGPTQLAQHATGGIVIDMAKHLRWLVRRGSENFDRRCERMLCLTDPIGRSRCGSPGSEHDPSVALSMTCTEPSDNFLRGQVEAGRRALGRSVKGPGVCPPLASPTPSQPPPPPPAKPSPTAERERPSAMPTAPRLDVRLSPASALRGVLGLPREKRGQTMLSLRPAAGGAFVSEAPASALTGAPGAAYDLTFRAPVSPLQAFAISIARFASR